MLINEDSDTLSSHVMLITRMLRLTHSLPIFLTNPSLLECVLSFTFCRVTTMSAATAKYFQASKDTKYYLYLARHSVLGVLVNERDDDTCAVFARLR